MSCYLIKSKVFICITWKKRLELLDQNLNYLNQIIITFPLSAVHSIPVTLAMSQAAVFGLTDIIKHVQCLFSTLIFFQIPESLIFVNMQIKISAILLELFNSANCACVGSSIVQCSSGPQGAAARETEHITEEGSGQTPVPDRTDVSGGTHSQKRSVCSVCPCLGTFFIGKDLICFCFSLSKVKYIHAFLTQLHFTSGCFTAFIWLRLFIYY